MKTLKKYLHCYNFISKQMMSNNKSIAETIIDWFQKVKTIKILLIPHPTTYRPQQLSESRGYDCNVMWNKDIPKLNKETINKLDLTQEQFYNRVGVIFSTINS